MFRTFVLFLAFLCAISYLEAISSIPKRESNSKKIISHSKQKRSFIETLFVSGTTNICKAVLGVAFPLETLDRVNFRTLVLTYNFQAQYMLVKPASYPWYAVKRSLHNQKEDFLFNKRKGDNTRLAVYNAVETLMNRKGLDGRACIQRAICENAQTPITVTGVFHEIINLFLTPSEADAEKCYTDARNAGLNHADCLLLYKCPMGSGIFDSIFHFI